MTPVSLPHADPFSTLIEVGIALCRTLRLRELLVTMMERTRAALDAEACSVMLVDDSGRSLRWEVALGEGAERLEEMSVALGEGISGRVAASGEAIRIDDAQSDPRWAGRGCDEATGTVTRSVLCVPMRAREKVIGVVQVLNRRGGPFTAEDEHLLEAIASMGGVAVENARLYENLEARVEERTAALSRALAELRAAQTQLVQSEKMAALGQLVAGVAHEINTPLGAVASNIDVTRRALAKLREELGETTVSGAAARYLERAAALTGTSREACERIAAIVRSLRAFSRLDEAERKPVDLHAGLDSTLTLVAHVLKDRIAVHRQYGELPQVDCFPNRLNQVFLNLLVNAAQAIEGKGEITIRTRFVGGETAGGGGTVVVEIADSGRGIAREHLERIFDPGFTTKGVGVGTGLGLAICYQIVDEHQGQIKVESMPGRGSTFRVVLPVARAT